MIGKLFHGSLLEGLKQVKLLQTLNVYMNIRTMEKTKINIRKK